MKKTLIVIFLLLLLCGCGVQQTEKPTQEAALSQLPSSDVSTMSNNDSLVNKQSDWHYDVKSDGIYRTDQITGESIKINNSFISSSISITDDWVYYKDNGLLYRMNNENRRELINSEECLQIQISGDKIYYKNSNGVNRMNLDGSEKELIFQREFVNMVLADQYIFYIVDVPYNEDEYHEDGPPHPCGELHRVDLNGKNDVNLGILIYNLEAYNNTVYFSDSSDNIFYSMNPDTLDRTVVYAEHWIETPCFFDDIVYFASDHVFYKFSLTDGTMIPLTQAYGIRCFGILDDYVYVDINNNNMDTDGLYRIRIDGKDLEKVE